ncbi:MAG: trypsin-like peptidase domain-containing protein [Verrucomicrobia bacterium]|nr:trypsin-like peptidase domain-containing protein [Verrucomicrobiota bacterium]MBI3870700.1 trypsin-like peptidase domain-containing protein [Verrucomicrobiota bacterium]
MDIGFTAITIPRSQVLKISTEREAKGKTAEAKSAETSQHSQVYFSAKSPPPERAVREWAKELGEAVVQVRTPGGLGSGFILNDEGFLITNFHVIEGETQISVEVYHQSPKGQLERRQYKKVRIVAMNKFQDLTLLKIEDEGAPKFKRVLIGSADALGQGERVFAIGSPLGFERTVTEGIVSTKSRAVQGNLFLQTTAQINPGNSGGPLFNLRGEVVGVTNMKITFNEGLGFAIPSEQVKYFLEHRDAYAYDNDNPSNAYRYLEPPQLPNKSGAATGQHKPAGG